MLVLVGFEQSRSCSPLLPFSLCFSPFMKAIAAFPPEYSYSGYVWKVGEINTAWQRRFACFEGDEFVYYKTQVSPNSALDCFLSIPFIIPIPLLIRLTNSKRHHLGCYSFPAFLWVDQISCEVIFLAFSLLCLIILHVELQIISFLKSYRLRTQFPFFFRSSDLSLPSLVVISRARLHSVKLWKSDISNYIKVATKSFP